MAMTDADARRFEYQLALVVAGCVLVAVLALTVFPGVLGELPGVPARRILAVAAVVLLLLALVAALGVWVHHRWFFSDRQRFRRRLGSPDEWLNVHEWRSSASEASVLAEARRFWPRPTAIDQPDGHPSDATGAVRPQQRRPGVRRDPVAVARAGWTVGEAISGRWPMRGRLVRAPYPRSVLVVGPQGSGKSQFAVPIILDFPGPLVVGSTKYELFNDTAAHRKRVGPVYVFDPLDQTGRHNFPFDPVWGCQVGERAELVAKAMVRGTGLGAQMDNRALWDGVGAEILRCYLLAAALKPDGSSFDVQRWSHDPDDPEPVRLLEVHHDRVPHGWISALRGRLRTNPRQRDGYFASVMAATDYLGSPAAASVIAAAAHTRFDLPRFLAERSTLYLIGHDQSGALAPLMTALTESLAYGARAAATAHAAAGGGKQRLPEPFGFVLDEVANMTPVNLPEWVAEFRGYGVIPFAFIQSRAQLDTVWSPNHAKIIWDDMITRVILGDLASIDFLEEISRLAGERTVQPRPQVTDRPDRTRAQETMRRTERLISAATVSALPQWHALVIGIPAEPVVVEFEPGYQRLNRERDNTPYQPRWPRWWRQPLRAIEVALAKSEP